MKKQGDRIEPEKDLPWPSVIDRPIYVAPATDYKFSLSDMPQEWIYQRFAHSRKPRVVSCMPDIGRTLAPPSCPFAEVASEKVLKRSEKQKEKSPLRNTIHCDGSSDYDDDYLAGIVEAYSIIPPEEVPDLTDDSQTLSSIDSAGVEVLSIKNPIPRCVQADFRTYSKNSQHQVVDAGIPPATPTHKVSMKAQPSDYVIMRTGEGRQIHYHARAADVDVTKFTRACSFRKADKYGHLEKASKYGPLEKPQPVKEPSSRVSSAESYFKKMGINKFYSPGYKKQMTQLQVIN